MQPTEDLSRAYSNADFVPGAADFPPRWREGAAALRAELGGRARTGLRYGPGARQVFDLFLPEGTPHGLMVFIHGGYWMSFTPADWSGFAAGGRRGHRLGRGARAAGLPVAGAATFRGMELPLARRTGPAPFRCDRRAARSGESVDADTARRALRAAMRRRRAGCTNLCARPII